jgi:nucleoside-diphosphate-sugar epimerase
MKVLVTGSEGSLMQQVIPLLLAHRLDVVGVDNFARYGVIERQRDYEFVQGDLTDSTFVDELMKGVDGVIQGAALIYGIGGFHRYPADILSKDVMLHQNVLWAMQKHQIDKIAYISSSMVYERCSTHPSPEDMVMDSLIPSTDYGLSKLVGERLVQAFHRQYGIKYVIWRPFNIITPYEEGEEIQGTSHVFADFIRNIVRLRKNPLPIIGSGNQVRCFTWIKDVAAAIAAYSFDKRTDNEDFNLGNQEPITMKELAILIYETAKEMALLPPEDRGLSFETVKEYEDDVMTRVPTVFKAEKILDWKARVKVHESVRYCLEPIKW